jgi:prepilin-type N-terminal cleavage/methylation domain-containing protein
MFFCRGRFRCGVTLVELTIAMAVSSIVALAVGVLLVSGQQAWHKTYNSANGQIKLDARALVPAFGIAARKANCLDVTVYEVSGGNFSAVQAQTSDEEVVPGDAIEFRYWDVDLDEDDSEGLMDAAKPATAYALFYFDDDELKVDYGPYPPGAVLGGGARNTSGVTTAVLSEHASAGTGGWAFSHTTICGQSRGSVRVNIVLTDPEDGDTAEVVTGAQTRNAWPR